MLVGWVAGWRGMRTPAGRAILHHRQQERLTGLAHNAKDVLKEFSIRARIEKLK
jgi:hypothetical protein